MKLISVKALSEELGVSKPTLFKRIDALNLRSELQKQGRALMIPESVAEKLREAYKTSEKAEKPNSTTDNSEITSALMEMLREELKSKNQLIENLQKQIEGLQEDNRRYMAMNTQLLLSAGSGAPESQPEPYEADYTEEPEAGRSKDEAGEEPKKGFFRRLFNL